MQGKLEYISVSLQINIVLGAKDNRHQGCCSSHASSLLTQWEMRWHEFCISLDIQCVSWQLSPQGEKSIRDSTGTAFCFCGNSWTTPGCVGHCVTHMYKNSFFIIQCNILCIAYQNSLLFLLNGSFTVLFFVAAPNKEKMKKE